MSRRKQKRPQHLVNADPGGPKLLAHDDHLGLKSPSTSLGSELTSSGSSSSSPTSIQDCQPPLAPRPSPGGLHAPSLPSESSPPPHWPNNIAPFTTSLPNTHSSLSPDFPHPSLSSQTHSPPALGQTSSCNQGNSHSSMTSPPMANSAMTTTSSSSLSSNCVPSHRDSTSPGPLQASDSPGQDQLQVPPTLAVLLEELRVLQQRQIHQMQITEEICRHVLRLGGAVFGQQNGTQVNGSDSTQKSSSEASASPTHPSTATPITTTSSLLTGLPSSLFPQPPTSKPSSANGTRASSSSTSSTISSSVASLHPLSLSLGLPPQYLHEKSPNSLAFGHSNGISFRTPVPTTSNSQEHQPSSSLGSGSSSGRPQHVCRFCGKVLSSDSSLQIHLRSHTGERPYQCPVCLSRFTTRGNLKAHFLRHREQNPELSLSLLPPALSEQTPSGSATGSVHRRRKRRAEDDEAYNGVKGSIPGMTENMALGFLSGGTSRPSPSSLPLPPSVDMALLSTAHSLLQLNRASVAASGSTTALPSSSSSTSSSPSARSAKQQRFDENTPPHTSLQSPYSQLAQLPKILFPGGTSPHHLALLRPPGHLAGPHQLPFPFPPFPKPSTSSSGSPTTSNQTSDTSKLQRLVQKLEKQPQGGSSSSSPSTSSQTAEANGDVNGQDLSTSAYRREMLAALGLSPSVNATSQGGLSSAPSLPTAPSPNQCGVCLRVLSCPRALRLHQATHLGERPFPCKLCGRSFSTKGSLRAHLATHRARPPNARALNSCPLCPRKFTNALVLQHHIRLHLGGQIPPDEEVPLEDSLETENIGLVDSVNDMSSKDQVLPLALTKGPRSPATSGSKQAADLTSMKECEGSVVSVSSPLTQNPSSAGDEEPPVDIGPNNFSPYSEKEANGDLSSTGSMTAPSTSANTAIDNGEDAPLSLCVSKSTIDREKILKEVSNDEASSAKEPTNNTSLTPPASPSNIPESEEKVEKGSSTNGIKAEDQKAQEDSQTEEGSSNVAPPPTQTARQDKPYSCSQCGKAYASRSGLKGHMKSHPGVSLSTPTKVQPHETEEEPNADIVKPGTRPDEKQVEAETPKGDNINSVPATVSSNGTEEPMDRTV
ncbi:sal-like protein 4 [Periophthalmus magnuspinnatus]|uniref:sal-like protein 4 n=1 Tax=Periophthalmus magnuspinnatus TaxID=409849 RepID=UPI00145B018C|nr:sal-like protein 4 [Periophthalmus magnuspinnatus]